MAQQLSLTIPIYWEQEFVTKPNKLVLIGLNQLFSMHYHVRNKLKKDLQSIIESQIPDNTHLPGQYTVTYTLYYKNSVSDPSNIIAGAEKVFLDALQEHGTITNDNPKYHLGSSWTVAGQDRTNPRIEVTITESE